MAKILDTSNNNSTPDWAKVKASGVEAVWQKATEGATFNDATYHSRHTAATAAGLRSGAYHYARPDHNSAVAEARHFVSVVGLLRRGELRPVLDFETWANDLSPAQHVQWARDFNRVVKAELGAWPVFYTYSDFLRRLNPDKTIGNGLWLANYGPNDGTQHPVHTPAPWKKTAAHQFTSRAKVPGCKGFVDLSEGNLRALVYKPYWLF